MRDIIRVQRKIIWERTNLQFNLWYIKVRSKRHVILYTDEMNQQQVVPLVFTKI